MKKLACIFVLLISFCAFSFGDEISSNKPSMIDNAIDTSVHNNLTWGLFFGLTIGTDFIKNHFSTDMNLTSYDYSKDGTDAGRSPSFGGINTEAKLGLIKTTKNVGFRIYGYYGRAWDSMETFGLNYTPINADGFYENAYLDAQYYGAMADILFGGFQDGDVTGYFSIGGGYQFTDYRLSGTASLGYQNSAFLDDDIYRSSISGSKIIQSPVANIGVGVMMGKHHLFEINLRYLFVNPTFVNESQTNLVGFAGTPVYKKHIPENTPIIIRESIAYNMNLTFNYMYKF